MAAWNDDPAKQPGGAHERRRIRAQMTFPDRLRIAAPLTALASCLMPSPVLARWALPSPLPAEREARDTTLRFDAGGPRWPREPAEPIRQPPSPEAVFWGWAATALVIAALLLPFSLTALVDLWRYLAR